MNGPIRKSRPNTAQKLAEARWSRRYFLRLSSLTGVGIALGAPLGTARAQGTTSLPASTPQPIGNPSSSGNTMNRDEIVQGLIRIGEQAIVREDDAALDAYFAEDFAFHGPLGDLDLPALKSFWASQRADLTITRGRIVVEGSFVAAQTTFSGVFEREFTQSPVGPLPPTGRRFTQNLINLFQYDEEGRLAEEWVQYDNRELLRELGAEGR